MFYVVIIKAKSLDFSKYTSQIEYIRDEFDDILVMEYCFKFFSIWDVKKISTKFLIESILYFRTTMKENFEITSNMMKIDTNFSHKLIPSLLERLDNEKNMIIIFWILRTIEEILKYKNIPNSKSISNSLNLHQILSKPKFSDVQHSQLQKLIDHLIHQFPMVSSETLFENIDEIPSNLKEFQHSNQNFCYNMICRKLNFKKIFRCSKCKQISYCSKECQISDWIFHKNDCTHF